MYGVTATTFEAQGSIAAVFLCSLLSPQVLNHFSARSKKELELGLNANISPGLSLRTVTAPARGPLPTFNILWYTVGSSDGVPKKQFPTVTIRVSRT